MKKCFDCGIPVEGCQCADGPSIVCDNFEYRGESKEKPYCKNCGYLKQFHSDTKQEKRFYIKNCCVVDREMVLPPIQLGMLSDAETLCRMLNTPTGPVSELVEIVEQYLFNHQCEMEGISSGMPSIQSWLDLHDKATKLVGKVKPQLGEDNE